MLVVHVFHQLLPDQAARLVQHFTGDFYVEQIEEEDRIFCGQVVEEVGDVGRMIFGQ